jgi:hypothetical protein
MNATTDSVTREAISRFLSQLSDEQKLYAFLLLSGPVLGPIKEKRSVYDVNGKLLGDYLPMPRPKPGEPFGMSDEAREALSKVKCMTREQWKAEKARAAAQPPVEPQS